MRSPLGEIEILPGVPSVKVMSGYFSNSPASLLSHIVKEENLSKKEIEKLKDIINKIDEK